MKNDILIDVQNLDFSYDKSPFITDLGFQLNQGELLGIIGPNGSGKTTALKLINRMLQPVKGQILVQSKPLHNYENRDLARVMGFMSSRISRELPFTCRQVLEMGRYPHHRGLFGLEPGDEEVIQRVLQYVGMEDFANRAFESLSSGEQQLLFFALLLVQDPAILLLDEPASHLDICHQAALFSMLQELAAEGRGILCTIHDLNLAARYCTRLLLLDQGKIKALGTPREVMTAQQLSRVYNVKLEVSDDPFSGLPRISLGRTAGPKTSLRVHIIGGASSARNLTRALYRMGIEISAGVAHQGDGDLELWQTLDIAFVKVSAFSEIGEPEYEKALSMINQADLTIMTSFPVGKGNERNLELALKAPRLWIEKCDPLPELFTAKAKNDYQLILKKARTFVYEDLIKAVKNMVENQSVEEHSRPT